MDIIDVVAGVIFNPARTDVLLALRKPGQHQGDRWEFPGGKQEPGESQTESLARELVEELGISVLQCRFRSTIDHAYSDKRVRLHFWDVTSFDGVPDGREGQVLSWVPISVLHEYRFPDANQHIVDELMVTESTE